LASYLNFADCVLPLHVLSHDSATVVIFAYLMSTNIIISNLVVVVLGGVWRLMSVTECHPSTMALHRKQAGDSMSGTREPPPYPGYHKPWQQPGTSRRSVICVKIKVWCSSCDGQRCPVSIDTGKCVG